MQRSPEEDLFQGKFLRDLGVAKVSSYPNDSYVHKARDIAIAMARREGEVTSDMVQAVYPPPPDMSPNAVGAIFRTKLLKIIGYTISKRPSAHARRIAIYQYNPTGEK